MQLVAPRGLSTRPMPIGCAVRVRRSRGRRPDATVEQALELRERLLELERALLDPCLHVARCALGHHRLEAVIGESRAARTEIVGEPGGARRRADRAETRRRGGVDDADVGQPVHGRSG